MAAADKKSQFELIVELVKALAWPSLAALVLWSFWTPLQNTASLMPSIVGRADTITIAGLSLKVGPALQGKATPEVRKVLTRLSKAGVERLLAMSSAGYWDKGSESNGRAENGELVTLGLAEEIPAAELQARNAKDGTNYGYGVRITGLGRDTQIFLRSVVAQFIEELSRAGVDSSGQ